MTPAQIGIEKKRLTEGRGLERTRLYPNEIYLQWALKENLILDEADLSCIFAPDYLNGLLKKTISTNSTTEKNALLISGYAKRVKGFKMCEITDSFNDEFLIVDRHEPDALRAARERIETNLTTFLKSNAVIGPSMLKKISTGIAEKFLSYSLYNLNRQRIIKIKGGFVTLNA